MTVGDPLLDLFKPRKSNPTYIISGCSATLNTGHARIESPGFGVAEYPNNLDCSWRITDPKSRPLTLVFEEFDTESRRDIVQVTNIVLKFQNL